MFGTHRTRLIDLTAKSRVPAIWPIGDYVVAGGLMSYGREFDDLFRRAATYVDKVLKAPRPPICASSRPPSSNSSSI